MTRSVNLAVLEEYDEIYMIQKRALRFLHIHCSKVNSYFSAAESNRPNPPDRTMDLHFFLRIKHVTSLKKNLVARTK